jgi:hypothetical protein
MFGTSGSPKDGELTTRLVCITSQYEDQVGYGHPWQIRLEGYPWRIGEEGSICAKAFGSIRSLVLGDLRVSVNHRIDQELRIRNWDALAPIVQHQPELERIIEKSGPETGWTRNPIPLFETLIKAAAELNEAEFQEKLEELDNLRKKAEDIMTVSYMSSWEKVLEAHRQEETFMKRCYQRLQKLKEERREAKELEEKLREMLGTFHMPPNSGFRG